jgi:hypothetical protein
LLLCFIFFMYPAYPHHFILLDFSNFNNTYWKKLTTKLPITQYSPSFCYFLTLGPKLSSDIFSYSFYLLFILFLAHMLFSYGKRPHSHPHQKKVILHYN